MAARELRLAFLLALAFTAACASAGDRLNDGIALQTQGRYMEAVYRYAEAVERDSELAEARERLVAAGDTAIANAMDQADILERRGDPVAAARLYRDLDQMMARVRQVGMRLDPPADYGMIRRAIFDNAVGWQMVRGDEAAEAGRWADARSYYAGARASFLEPSRIHVEESYDSETTVLLKWAETELDDARPRRAHGLAQEALQVRSSPARDVVLSVRDLQERALADGTVVVAMLPVTAAPGVRSYLGPAFEIQLDEDLSRDHWNQPPPFVGIADPVLLGRELRGLLRGQVQQSPIIVGRALELIGADLGVLIELSRIEVVEDHVDRHSREVVVPRASAGGRGANRAADQPMDTVTYSTVEGQISYDLHADIILVDVDGREIEHFTASSRQTGPFLRGEFDGDPSVLPLRPDERRFFDPAVVGQQAARVHEALLEGLAVSIAQGTYDTVLSGIY